MKDPDIAKSETQSSMRLDIWLWAARFFKTRSLSKQAISTGKIELNGQRPKVSAQVRLGDRLQVQRADETYEIVVDGLSETRGPASLAQTLYSESEQSKKNRETARAMRAAERIGYRPPETKPDKRARRLIRALGDIDAS